MADLGGALYGLSAVLAAIIQRDRTGEGQFIDLSMTDCLAHWVNTRRAVCHEAGIEDIAGQRRVALVRPAYGVFPTAEGGAVSVAALEGHFWKGVCAALDMGGFDDPRYDDIAARRDEAEAINARMAEQIAPHSRDAIMALFEDHDVPAAPVLTPAEAAGSEHFRARNLMQDSEAGPITPFPVRLKGMGTYREKTPDLDQGPKG